MNFSMGEFSTITGLGIHTLRYYEKEKLIIPARKDNGRRCYSENDVSWIQFIKRLKDTNMSIKEIRKYAELRVKGNSTLIERMEMLKEHRIVLKEQIAKSQESLGHLDDKIEYYQTEIDKQHESAE
ncbi:MerR family transcriptional regulator [Ethanoligenens sp.]|uniref:MerR family transcriptional regulator n=1 Tax=Ethanoligenens sp. TaxID=2099655 RepID=UPI0039E7B33B